MQGGGAALQGSQPEPFCGLLAGGLTNAMKRILIVDDAIDLARLLQDALKIAHPEVPITVVPSAEEALLEASRLTIDVLVTDLRLPGMSGIDLVRKIRVRQPNVKVILMTGLNPDDRLWKQKEEVAADIFLRKPIITSNFLESVEQLLGEGPAAEKPAASKGDQAVNSPAKAKESGSKKTAALSPSSAKTGSLASGKEKEDLLKELAAVMPGEPAEEKQKPAQARKPTGSLTPAPASEQGEEGLSSIVSRLRSSLGAVSAILLDERGHPVVQSGDLPDLSLEGQIASPMVASISAGAKIAYHLGQTATQFVQAYRGVTIDLVIAPVGQYALLLALPTGRSTLRLALAVEEALNAQAEMSAALETMGIHVQQLVEVGTPDMLLAELTAGEEKDEEAIPPEILETPLGQDLGLEKFEELFTRKKTGQLRLQDPDDFWDSASSGSQDVAQSGVLSFEQAQKLGLVPPEATE